MAKLTIVYPQWQGGADAGTYRGARELEELYLEDVDFEKVPVATDDDLREKCGIVGFDALARQMAKAAGILENAAPDALFCLGGGCDADVPAIAYLNERYRGDLAVLWLDAHGDLNTPQESATALFYGMPLRAAMDPACFGLMPIARPLTVGQVVHVGARDLDPAEIKFIDAAGIRHVTVWEIKDDPLSVSKVFAKSGFSRLYVHLDLDVLEPAEFPYTPLPVEGGISGAELVGVLESVWKNVVGLGLCEYAPVGMRHPLVERIIDLGLSL